MNIHVKTLPITFDMVIEAYSKAKGGGKAVGIDRESWRSSSRKASGSYFPHPSER